MSNKATFTFTPASTISPYGGYIVINTPNWYSSQSTPQQPYDHQNFECSSSRFISIDTSGTGKQTQRIRQNNQYVWIYSYNIKYTGLYGAETDPITIECIYWRNPIIHEISTGYTINTRDINNQPMDDSDVFSLDTTAFTPYQVPDTSVTYSITQSKIELAKVQTNSVYTVQVQSPVPLEATGCYVKFNFPKELQVESGGLAAY